MTGRFDVDLALWGKSRGLNGHRYPLVCHLLDAAAAMEALWDEYVPPRVRTVITDGLGTTENHARALLASWAGLHDIGKVMACFQALDADGFARLTGYPDAPADMKGHAFAAHVWLGQALAEAGYKATGLRSPAVRVAQLLGGHHGTFFEYRHRELTDPVTFVPALGTGRWEEQRRRITAVVHELTGAPKPPTRLPAPVAALTCGLVILADWLVSQDVFLRKRIAAGLPAAGTPEALREHFDRSRQAAPGLLREAGLGRLTFKPGGFHDDFPFQPNDLQRSIAERLPGLLDGEPGLLLIMAPMGEGKTEAALHAARLMGETAGTPGVFFGLPTMATSDQMFDRLAEFRARRAEGADSLTLLHGLAWLNSAYAPDGEAIDVLTEDRTATQWLRGSKRGLLANLAVGTVDQALLAVLRGRHNVLRMLGLVGKVVVIDEVHAYDAYMQGLLHRLLSWLGAFKIPVVLMSATLPVTVGRKLVEAYLEGGGQRGTALPELRYPGWVYVSAGQASSQPVKSRERALRVELRHVALGLDGRAERADALKELLAPLVADGGCAAVICNTVAEAQRTYLELKEWLAATGTAAPVMRLLHSRFPAWRREEITREVVALFGKDAGDARPAAAVLVATQVIEQSLDLDFDLVISDLAPIALLLQRAGRCHRHQANDPRRPGWARQMRLVVLAPTDEAGALAFPRAWRHVYHQALLRRTFAVLTELTGRNVAIPGDVQGLVNRVYDEDFADLSAQVAEDDLARIADEQTKEMYASMVAIPPPKALKDLSSLSQGEIVDEYATRLGADSGRVVCCHPAPDGRLLLRTGDPLPHAGAGRDGRFTKEQLKRILLEAIPVPGGWLKDRSAENEPPPAWRDNPHLRDIALIRLLAGHGPGLLGERTLWLSDELGLSEFPAPPECEERAA
ncbi:CRISPR-associated helicase Cas3' [Thermobispora bispora]|uniref:CRISPR-associated helicase Cas3' n=1 Tax=Thermobispora bispora TaxID=2006 RepID=UPI001982291F|nr:CRISPR-associated helicase Cas3' [Thermobispora bispora]QSI48081.1 CRISPR-associated helicase Cas3' [Thermobispora bispora]